MTKIINNDTFTQEEEKRCPDKLLGEFKGSPSLSTIEDKRKELEETKNDLMHDAYNNPQLWKDNAIEADGILKGFNLGVELARKEFLDILDKTKLETNSVDLFIEYIKQFLNNYQIGDKNVKTI